MQDDNKEPTNEEMREAVVHALGETVLGVLGAMAEGADQPSVSEVPEAQMPEGKTPEEFTEKIFGMAKDSLAKQGELNPGIFSFKKGGVKGFFVRNNPGGEFIRELIERIVRNDTPEAYAVIVESWMNEAKKDIPSEMDPEAKEAIVALFKGKSAFQLIQFFHHDEQEHKKIVFDGDIKKLTAAFKGRFDVPLRNPTSDYIG